MTFAIRRLPTLLFAALVCANGGFVQPPATSSEPESGYFEFGHDIALDKGIMAVATQGKTFDSTSSGMVFMFRKDNGQWMEDAILRPPEPSLDDAFGSATALSGDWCMVGAPGKKLVQVFRRLEGTWRHHAQLRAPQSHSAAVFGISVALEGDTCVVGAFGYRDTGQQSAAFVFRNKEGTWQQEAVLSSPRLDVEGGFGQSVRLSGENIAIAAPYESATSGAVHTFQRARDGSWKHTGRLIDESGESMFYGTELSLNGKHLAICSRAREQVSDRIHVYHAEVDGWRLRTTLSADADDSPPTFGGSVSIDGDLLVAGSGGGMRMCPIRVYQFEHEQWVQKDTLVIADTKPEERGARCLTIEGSEIAVGSNTTTTPGVVHTFRSSATGWVASQSLQGSGLPSRGYADEPLAKRMQETPPVLTLEQIRTMTLDEARFAAKWIVAARSRSTDAETTSRLKQEFSWIMEHLRTLRKD